MAYRERMYGEELDVATEAEALGALKENGHALERIPKALRTKAVCMEAVRRARVLHYVPEDVLDSDICFAAIFAEGLALGEVPEPMRTEELCLAAVQSNGRALEHIPETMRTWELCLAAVQQDGKALRHVPSAVMTLEIMMRAVRQSGCALAMMPDWARVKPLCFAALKQDAEAIRYLPACYRYSEEFLAHAVVLNPKIMRSFGGFENDDSIFLAAVKADGLSLDHVPEHWRSPAICEEAVRQNPWAMEFVPEAMRTKAFARRLAKAMLEGPAESPQDILLRKKAEVLELAAEFENKGIRGLRVCFPDGVHPVFFASADSSAGLALCLLGSKLEELLDMKTELLGDAAVPGGMTSALEHAVPLRDYAGELLEDAGNGALEEEHDG